LEQEFDKDISNKYYNRFGKVAVELGLITPEQLKEALTEQIDDNISNRPHRLIGRILFERGWISPEQIEKVLDILFKKL
jgi:hypothetical protein